MNKQLVPTMLFLFFLGLAVGVVTVRQHPKIIIQKGQIFVPCGVTLPDGLAIDETDVYYDNCPNAEKLNFHGPYNSGEGDPDGFAN